MRTVTFIALAAALLLAHPAAAQYVYFGDQPRTCAFVATSETPTVNVYIAAAECAGTIGATFRIETFDIVDEGDIVSITPEPGVLVSGDLFTGLTLVWSPRVMDHTRVLAVELARPIGMLATRDVTIHCLSGPVPGQDVHTIVANSMHCWDPVVGWVHPDTVDVVIGQTSDFSIEAMITAEMPFAGGAQVIDENGWAAAENWYIPSMCPACPWDWATLRIVVDTPEDTPAGTLNPIAIQAIYFGNPLPGLAEIVLRAIEPVTVQTKSWGEVKALFRESNEDE